MAVTITDEELDLFNKNGFTDDDVRATVENYRSQGLDDNAIRAKVQSKIDSWNTNQNVKQPINNTQGEVEEVSTQPVKQATPVLTGGIEQKVIPNWDKKGRIYYTDEQGNRIKSNVPLSRKIGNKLRAIGYNVKDWLTTDVGEKAKERRKAVAMLVSTPLGVGRGITGMALSGGLGSGVYSGSEQLIDTGKISPMQTLKDTAIGAGLGGALGLGGKYIVQPIAKNIARRTNIAKRRAIPLAERMTDEQLARLEQPQVKPQITEEVVEEITPIKSLNSLNPSESGVYEKYLPQERANLPLGENITTYDKTANIKPDDVIEVYRGVPKNASETLNAGDFITTNKQLAKDYAGNGKVISQKVKASEILDDISEPLGEEYIYRPQKIAGESVPQQIEQPKINLNTLKSNIRANKFEQGNLNDYMVVGKGKKGYKSTIAEPISYDIENSQRDFNKIIIEISKNPEKLNEAGYLDELENRVQQIIDRTPYGETEEVAMPYWEKLWKAVDDGNNYNEFKLNSGNKPQQLDEVAGDIKTRSLPQSVLEAKGTPKEVKEIIKQDMPTYQVMHNQDLIKQATDEIAGNFDNELIRLSSAKDFDALDYEKSRQIAKNLFGMGKYQKAVDLIDNVSENATKKGQAIQALSLWSNMTPEGAVYKAQKLVREYNKKYPKKQIQLTDENIETIAN